MLATAHVDFSIINWAKLLKSCTSLRHCTTKFFRGGEVLCLKWFCIIIHKSVWSFCLFFLRSCTYRHGSPLRSGSSSKVKRHFRLWALCIPSQCIKLLRPLHLAKAVLDALFCSSVLMVKSNLSTRWSVMLCRRFNFMFYSWWHLFNFACQSLKPDKRKLGRTAQTTVSDNSKNNCLACKESRCIWLAL